MIEVNVQTEMEMLRPRLLRFAQLQLRSSAAAEDAVQETLLAAIEAQGQFNGAAAWSTWVFPILKNKIVDELRRRREPETDALPADDTTDSGDYFAADGHWMEMPTAWAGPEQALEQSQFWAVFEACLNGLPPKPCQVFMMREFLGLETEEICKELAISASNCWVLLHRARLGLRECLSLRWFGATAMRGK
ncbi:MAG: sigma-70 family RNA polymerase sigma factor [Rhodocyclaceae bacterium]|nr:sigma-70 family RNA polymerase sigma factor [Rhodocyclaceae bacterium]